MDFQAVLGDKLCLMTQKTQASNPAIWQLKIDLDNKLSEDEENIISTAFEDMGYAVSLTRDDKDNTCLVSVLSMDLIDPREVTSRLALLEQQVGIKTNASFVIEQVPDIDWLSHVYEQLKPIEIKPFFIYGSHREEKAPQGFFPIEINAATAFGTGEHPTTKGCLMAIAKLHANGFDPKSILDLGCGSAILAIAAAKVWPKAAIIGTDMDEESVRVAIEYSAINQVSENTAYETAMGYDSELIRSTHAKNKGFDLILANILAGPLVELAPETYAHTKHGGKIILSGLLQTQKDAVLTAHTHFGLRLVDEYPIGDWTALVLEKD